MSSVSSVEMLSNCNSSDRDLLQLGARKKCARSDEELRKAGAEIERGDCGALAAIARPIEQNPHSAPPTETLSEFATTTLESATPAAPPAKLTQPPPPTTPHRRQSLTTKVQIENLAVCISLPSLLDFAHHANIRRLPIYDIGWQRH